MGTRGARFQPGPWLELEMEPRIRLELLLIGVDTQIGPQPI
jgi:hypothetical protein